MLGLWFRLWVGLALVFLGMMDLVRDLAVGIALSIRPEARLLPGFMAVVGAAFLAASVIEIVERLETRNAK